MDVVNDAIDRDERATAPGASVPYGRHARRGTVALDPPAPAASVPVSSAASLRDAPASERWTTRGRRLLPLLAQLALALAVILQYNLESRTFFHIAVVAVIGFAMHAMLPLAYRLPFFVALSFAGIAVAFGLADGTWLVTVGLVLIGICHLPIRLGARVALLAAAGVALAVSRSGIAPAPWSHAVWPILASMFMFRLAVYLYALQHDRTPASPSRTLAYFFMLPNVCFPLFPVVDYGTFARCHYDRDEMETYARGVQWIVRGLVHLLIYRFVYQNLAGDPAQLDGLGDVVQFMLATFLLYLRVSGQFHLIVGMLHLFGFRLPETHHLYYLASGFTDFWRRINIYWKDFMMKLVYYPSFFRLRRWGDRTALAAATVIVFLATWLLHSYQWFWLRGGFPVTAQDGLFWGVLGGLVVANALRDAGRARRRRAAPSRGWRVGLAIRTALMFWSMTVLWSLWSAESLGEWLAMWLAATRVDAFGILLILGVTAVLLLAGGRDWDAPAREKQHAPPLYRRPAVQGTALMVLLLVLGHPAIYHHVGEPRVVRVVASLHSSTLNARDAAVDHKGYYEKLDDVGRLDAQLWSTSRPAHFIALEASELYRHRADFLQGELRPSVSVVHNGQLVSTNRWGMRDRDYSLAKPPHTYRIALLGPSLVMGLGGAVRNEETFESLLESRLNAEATDGTRYEVLNFGVGSYSFLQQMALLSDRVWSFQPDAVIVTTITHDRQVNTMVEHLVRVAAEDVPVPYAELDSMLRSAGVEDAKPSRAVLTGRRFVWLAARKLGASREMVDLAVERRLRGIGDEILAWSVRRIAQEARDHGAVPVLLGLEVVSTSSGEELPAANVAEESGFVVIDMLNVYDGQDPSRLRSVEWDSHPNAQGQRLIADRLYAELVRHDAELRLGIRPTMASASHGEEKP